KDVRMVATDGNRLAMSTRSIGKAIPYATGIVLRKAASEIMPVIGAGAGGQLAITENQFVLQMPNFVMTARLIEGQFPNYEAVLPRAHPGKLVIPRAAFMAALRRVWVMAEERNNPVKLLLRPGALVLSAASHDLGEAEESLSVQYAGEEVAIGFNSRYVLEALTPIEKDEILFEFKDGLSPGVVKSVEEEGYCCFIMPMRIYLGFPSEKGSSDRLQIGWIQLVDFRNYHTLSYHPSAALNLLTGANAQGKSNLLEALAVLLTGRSFRTSRLAEIPRWGAESVSLAAELRRADGARTVRRGLRKREDGVWQGAGEEC